jgi:hypothetical protein
MQMKKQEFRQYKTRSSRTARQEYEELKTRTIAALDKLGHQKFSAESGGYSLENWMKGVNLLLDEFEEKVGATRLPPEYTDERRKMNHLLSRPVDVSSINEKISELGEAEAEVSGKIGEARALNSSRIEGLQSELDTCSADLEEEKRRLAGLAAGQRSRPFFGRLFGGNSKSTTNASEEKVKELESKLSTLTNEILEQQKSLKSIDQRSPESPCAEEWEKLELLQARLVQLQDDKRDREQLVREREKITASIANAISKIPPSEDGTGEATPSG